MLSGSIGQLVDESNAIFVFDMLFMRVEKKLFRLQKPHQSKANMQYVMQSMSLAPSRREKMLTTALVLTGGEADLLSRLLEEVKTKTFEESQISLDDLGALKALVSHFRDAETVESDKEVRQISVNPLSKRLFLGHIIGREGSADAASGSRQS